MRTKRRANPTYVRFVVEILIAGTFAIFLAVSLRVFLFQTFLVPSGSMESTIHAYDEIVIFKGAYRLFGVEYSRPKRGDVVVFRAPTETNTQYIKRVIAIEGDTITIAEGGVWVNDAALDEPYISTPTSGNISFTLPAGELFVMGDNRASSSDSRDYGTIRREDIIGRAIAVFAPAPHRRLLRRP